MAATEPNPYSPPQSIDLLESSEASSAGQRTTVTVRRRLAFFCMVLSALGSMIYTYLDMSVMESNYGAWPMLWATAAIACGVALYTRDWMFAPLCCFAGTMSGDLLAWPLRSWQYAQVPTALKLSALYSLPAFVLAVIMLLGKRRMQNS